LGENVLQFFFRTFWAEKKARIPLKKQVEGEKGEKGEKEGDK
jgi:hypothetical protein